MKYVMTNPDSTNESQILEYELRNCRSLVDAFFCLNKYTPVRDNPFPDIDSTRIITENDDELADGYPSIQDIMERIRKLSTDLVTDILNQEDTIKITAPELVCIYRWVITNIAPYTQSAIVRDIYGSFLDYLCYFNYPDSDLLCSTPMRQRDADSVWSLDIRPLDAIKEEYQYKNSRPSDMFRALFTQPNSKFIRSYMRTITEGLVSPDKDELTIDDYYEEIKNKQNEIIDKSGFRPTNYVPRDTLDVVT